jgi:hypothetical protein
MKCIKSVKQTKQISLGEIIRVTDEDAIEKVKGGFWVYAPKSEWKQDRVGNKTENSKTTTTEEPKVKKGKSKKELKLEKKRNK